MKNISHICGIGVDLTKNAIQIYAVGDRGRTIMNRRFTRTKAQEFFEKWSQGRGDCNAGICTQSCDRPRTCAKFRWMESPSDFNS